MNVIRRDRLTAEMKDAGISQSQLARLIGVSPATIQQILSGKTKSSVHLPAIARVLNVDLDWLLDLSDQPHGAAEQVALKSITAAGLMSLTAQEDGLPVSLGVMNYDLRMFPYEDNGVDGKLIFTELGDEMSPFLRHDDFVLIDMSDQELLGPESIYLVWEVARERQTLCRIHRIAGEMLRLSWDAATITDRDVSIDAIRIGGRAVMATRKL